MELEYGNISKLPVKSIWLFIVKEPVYGASNELTKVKPDL